MMAWVKAAQDNAALPYIVIDKPAALLYLFAADGTLLGQTPVLLGIGIGDDSTPGVGAKKLEDIGPAERTTPAGRYVAKFGRAFGHERVLWVDYANSVAIHAVITTNKKEKRVQRLLSPSPDDNRISFGCVNVGTPFYTRKLSPLFKKTGGVVYILPDTKTLDEVFPRLRLLPYLDGAAQSEPAA
ncbi:L,D-transpeptidase [Sphingomonas sp. PP-CE-1G-424]|uniref:L,D-transpeptidase n=1 Tax=Sphingomonas sp. PP-CE-1G-424 TaxID=2135658 RepID=UPI001FB2A278|nr:L,D-transpeptidase [Sphingomonas sp. PP-CE-1G-424]